MSLGARTRMDSERQLRDGAVQEDGTLTVKVWPCEYSIAGTNGTFAGATAHAVTNTATNYVYLTSAGALASNTTGFPTTAHVRLATVVCAGGAITAINPKRVFLAASEPDPTDNTVDGDVPTPATDGTEVQFTTTDIFNPDKVKVYLNGMRQKEGIDYDLDGGDQSFTMSDPPITGDTLLVDYTKA